MRIGFIGCVTSSHKILQALLGMGSSDVQVVAVVTKSESSINADFVDLAPLCQSHNIPFHYEDGKDRKKSVEFFRQHNLDVIYCIGWSYLLGSEMLALAPLGGIGFHPAPLPKAR